jgi:hypothetical protein
MAWGNEGCCVERDYEKGLWKKETSLVIPDTAEGPSKQWLSLGFREHRKA